MRHPTSQPLLTEATFRAHIRAHSIFFDKKERWRARCQRLCRICGGELREGIEEHLEQQHPRWNFACEGDLEEDSMETVAVSEPSFLAMKSNEKTKKEVSGLPTDKSSPTSLTQFHVKVEKPDNSYQQPCKTERCSLSSTVRPSPVAVLCHQTASTCPSASPSLSEDYTKEVPVGVREPYCHTCRLPLLTSLREHCQEDSHQLHLADTQPCTFCPSRLKSITPQAHFEQKHAEEMFRCILGSCNSSFNLFLSQ